MKEKVLFSWSGGKDSAAALYVIEKAKKYDILSLLTIITEDYDRVSMHGIRRTLIERQAEALALPLKKIFISKKSSSEEYESAMYRVLKRYLTAGASSVIFGDVFLEDLRRYREKNLAKIGMQAIFPIWKRNTAQLADDFITLGFKAIITCVDTNALDKAFLGREFDKYFLSELPDNVNPCGENGEFHTFVYDGPIFSKKILFKKGRIVVKGRRFYYCDLIPSKIQYSTEGNL